MIITINGKELTPKLGIKFLKQLDDHYFLNIAGVKFGAGVSLLTRHLQAHNPVAAAQGLSIALNVKLETIENHLEGLDADELEVLMDDFLALLQSTPLIQVQLKKTRTAEKQAMAQMAKTAK